MFSFLSRSWWLPFLGGLVAILFGILAIVTPGTAISVLLILFAVFVLFQGAGLVWSGVQMQGPGGFALGATGIVLLIFGIWTLVATESAAELLVIIMGVWALALGIMTVMSSFALRGRTDRWWLPCVGGVILAIAGLLVIIQPWAGVAAIAITIGTGSIMWGVFLSVIGWMLRKIGQQDDHGVDAKN